MYGGGGSATITYSNNTTIAQIKGTNPLFTNGSGLFNTPLDFKPVSGSYAIGAGTTVPGVYSAFDGAARPAAGTAVDMGAF